MEWWEDFFDTVYTDAWEAAGAFDDTDAQVAALLTLLDLEGPADVLDAPCGFGRISGPLAAAGHRVVGLDASEDQLRLARQRNPGPTYLRGDMGAPPDGPFDVVLNLYSSFGYRLDDRVNASILQAWFDVLRPGGVLVIEGMHRDRVAHLASDEPVRLGDAVTEHPDMDWVHGIMRSRVDMPDGSQRRLEMRVYTVTELVAMLQDVGFVQVRATGGYDDPGPPTPRTRLLVHARRPR